MSVPAIETASYQYELSQDRIATHPVQPRDHSRLLVYENGRITDSVFTDLSSFLPAGSLIVFNNSKVIPARLWFRKPEGGLIELFLLEPMKGSMAEVLSTTAPVEMLCMVGGFKKWKGREILQWPLHEEHHLMARLVQKEEEGFVIRFEWDDTGLTFSDVLEQAGKIPIPPYLLRESEACDSTDYQTIYAREKGSVAAPTAGLHFTSRVMDSLEPKNIRAAYTTLHVGAGTFKPMNTAYVHEHSMHAEWISADRSFISQLAKSETLCAVGTTSLRTIESLYWYSVFHQDKPMDANGQFMLPQFFPYEQSVRLSRKSAMELLLQKMDEQRMSKLHFRTALMIMPGYTIRMADYLLTNFHQPGSTLLLLVDAFLGGQWKNVYQHALENSYRFLSYGDACLLQLQKRSE